MSNQLYAKGKENLLDKKFDLNTDTMKVALTDHGGADGTPNTSTHDDYGDIDGSTVGTPGTLDSPTITNGTFDAADEPLGAVSGATVESLTIYMDSGSPATSLLLVYIDTGTNLTGGFTPNGGSVTIAWHSSGIFSL